MRREALSLPFFMPFLLCSIFPFYVSKNSYFRNGGTIGGTERGDKITRKGGQNLYFNPLSYGVQYIKNS